MEKGEKVIFNDCNKRLKGKVTNIVKSKYLQTILGTEIPITTRGILYICNYKRDSIEVVSEILCNDSFDALNYYANIPNPESQLITGKTYDELITNMHLLHKSMKNPKWLKELGEAI